MELESYLSAPIVASGMKPMGTFLRHFNCSSVTKGGEGRTARPAFASLYSKRRISMKNICFLVFIIVGSCIFALGTEWYTAAIGLVLVSCNMCFFICSEFKDYMAYLIRLWGDATKEEIRARGPERRR